MKKIFSFLLNLLNLNDQSFETSTFVEDDGSIITLKVAKNNATSLRMCNEVLSKFEKNGIQHYFEQIKMLKK